MEQRNEPKQGAKKPLSVATEAVSRPVPEPNLSAPKSMAKKSQERRASRLDCVPAVAIDASEAKHKASAVGSAEGHPSGTEAQEVKKRRRDEMEALSKGVSRPRLRHRNQRQKKMSIEASIEAKNTDTETRAKPIVSKAVPRPHVPVPKPKKWPGAFLRRFYGCADRSAVGLRPRYRHRFLGPLLQRRLQLGF